ncbi:hypothetical protein BB65665_17717 [Bacillus sp. 916]|nr:hypothetical protein U722_16200 [Bacillus amyloliquefaciens LFB112]AMQ71401.1 hypothetical protein BAMY6639_07050 [Bacillus amyloliquefaciens UMAF6639]EJD66162.1 hypothetical protein BB65665_17717 [Bacillus sp. 916]ERH57691.1 hypothetical protein O205_18865 [Bacillus amyloliquefaciens EGD-AQ14]ERK85181.1 hypothetical protein N786_04205 [Bacillus amyloliquefaciens UASWS BA1]
MLLMYDYMVILIFRKFNLIVTCFFVLFYLYYKVS